LRSFCLKLNCTSKPQHNNRTKRRTLYPAPVNILDGFCTSARELLNTKVMGQSSNDTDDYEDDFELVRKSDRMLRDRNKTIRFFLCDNFIRIYMRMMEKTTKES
jgi:hypothetical protein